MNKYLRFGIKGTLLAVTTALMVAGAGMHFDRRSGSFSIPSASAQPHNAVPVSFTIDSAKALGGLAADLESLVSLDEEVKTGRVGIMVRSLATDRVIYVLNGDKPLTPASTTKVVTTFTALSELGADYMVTTDAALANKPKDGVLVGDLYIRGHGDPNLTVGDIDQLVEQILAAGIHQINGNVVGDGSFFDNKYVRTEYSGDAEEVEHLPPISALSIERNAFTVIVSSARTPGQPCNVQTYPRSSGFEIINTAVSVAPQRAPVRRGSKRKRRHAELLEPIVPARTVIDDENAPRVGDEPLTAYNARPAKKKPTPRKKAAAPAGKTPSRAAKTTRSARKVAVTKKPTGKARSTTKGSTTKVARQKVTPRTDEREPVAATASVGALRVSISGERDGRQIIHISGGLQANRTQSYRYEMKNPPLVVAGIVYDRLRAGGIKISGTPISGSAPRQVKVIGQVGRPLLEIVENVMKHSNNYLAEYVFKMIGAANGGQKETAERSMEVIDQRMNKAHVPFGKCIINDGSGLSRANCLSVAALEGMLTAAYRDQKVFPALYSIMSIAGVDGTLRRRMKGTYAEGNVRGKTGTLKNVSALAGYATSRDGEMFVFATLMNGGRHGAYKDVQNRIAQRLAAFSYAESQSADK